MGGRQGAVLVLVLETMRLQCMCPSEALSECIKSHRKDRWSWELTVITAVKVPMNLRDRQSRTASSDWASWASSLHGIYLLT